MSVPNCNVHLKKRKHIVEDEQVDDDGSEITDSSHLIKMDVAELIRNMKRAKNLNGGAVLKELKTPQEHGLSCDLNKKNKHMIMIPDTSTYIDDECVDYELMKLTNQPPFHELTLDKEDDGCCVFNMDSAQDLLECFSIDLLPLEPDIASQDKDEVMNDSVVVERIEFCVNQRPIFTLTEHDSNTASNSSNGVNMKTLVYRVKHAFDDCKYFPMETLYFTVNQIKVYGSNLKGRLKVSVQYRWLKSIFREQVVNNPFYIVLKDDKAQSKDQGSSPNPTSNRFQGTQKFIYIHFSEAYLYWKPKQEQQNFQLTADSTEFIDQRQESSSMDNLLNGFQRIKIN